MNFFRLPSGGPQCFIRVKFVSFIYTKAALKTLLIIASYDSYSYSFYFSFGFCVMIIAQSCSSPILALLMRP